MNKITFDSALRRGNSGCMAALVPLAEAFPLAAKRRAPSTACAPVAAYDFAQQVCVLCCVVLCCVVCVCVCVV